MNQPAYYTSMREGLRRIFVTMFLPAVFSFVLYAYLHFSETERPPDVERDALGILFSILLGCLCGVALKYSNRKLDRLIPWSNQFAARLLTGYTANVLLVGILIFGTGTALISVAGPDSIWRGFSSKDEDLVLKILILLLTIMFVYNIVYALLFSYQHYAITQIETLQRDRRQLELQFEALKSQISPHYLFNSLNTISSLIFKDLPSAEQFIRRLAQTYQFILTTQHKRYVTLQEEVDFVQSYYYLLRIRFQQQLHVEINLPSGIMKSKIPPLTLQMLVENAVKHNPIRSDKKLFIYISAQDNSYLRVVNTKTGVIDNVTSFRVGLENIQKRYQLFTDKKIEVRDDEKFSVSLPLIHLNEKTERPFLRQA
ncbi:sensor histidine kinase [Ohtaekwangia koreensis]|uniref:Histidine kinase n=1 Tax=Ohtaekwangia koreensis TaxID=688867 RepID=A0A1T5MDN3_9BACT|nr:histidine kinase [Ohtaekwangia koreensis]SKC86094.1 Histidine kinase [Ohtaekwangia koreensis]